MMIKVRKRSGLVNFHLKLQWKRIECRKDSHLNFQSKKINFNRTKIRMTVYTTLLYLPSLCVLLYLWGCTFKQLNWIWMKGSCIISRRVRFVTKCSSKWLINQKLTNFEFVQKLPEIRTFLVFYYNIYPNIDCTNDL